MIRITELRLPYFHSKEELEQAIRRELRLKETDGLEYEIRKQSLDARKKENIVYQYMIFAKISPEAETKILQGKKKNITKEPPFSYAPQIEGTKELEHPPVIIGTGPCGLFAGLLLAEYGYRPLLLERGAPVEERVSTVNGFWKGDPLDPESNVSFGEGGAGTFSDGKLNTLIKDPYGRGRKVLEEFVRFGADPAILYEQKPHIGTDCLRKIVSSIRQHIVELGGQVKFHSRVTSFLTKEGRLFGVVLASGETIPCESALLAPGHSARDLFQTLFTMGVSMESKAFAMGLRIEHLQEDIGFAQYGSAFSKLPPAPYKLTGKGEQGRGIYTFCMCPGGYVVNASTEPGGLVVNGMSLSSRESANANSALIVTVNPGEDRPKEQPPDPLAGVRFQRKWEQRAFAVGQGKIPMQLWGDFLENRISTGVGKVKPLHCGASAFGNLRDCLPGYVSDTIKTGMIDFGRKIKGFDHPEAILSGVETRTSSPLRILRDPITLESSIRGLYPGGEGAGYAGGITSAAMDGLQIFEQFIRVYKPIGAKDENRLQ